jgi:hypothetical protein
MLTFFFTSYRETFALYLLPPLLVASVVLTLVAAFTLGKTGKKVGRWGLGHREARLMAIVLGVVALTAMHLALLLGGGLALERRTVPASLWIMRRLACLPTNYHWDSTIRQVIEVTCFKR